MCLMTEASWSLSANDKAPDAGSPNTFDPCRATVAGSDIWHKETQLTSHYFALFTWILQRQSLLTSVSVVGLLT